MNTTMNKNLINKIVSIKNNFQYRYNSIKPLRWDKKETQQACPGPKFKKWDRLQMCYCEQTVISFYNTIINSSSASTWVTKYFFSNFQSQSQLLKQERLSLANTLKHHHIYCPIDVKQLQQKAEDTFLDIQDLINTNFTWYSAKKNAKYFSVPNAYNIYHLLNGVICHLGGIYYE